MKLKKIIKRFENESVCVVGKKGRGKDMLMSNVVMRRKLPYVANINYGGSYLPLDLQAIACGGNTYKDFLNGTVKPYTYPYADGTDFYISDIGVYFPSQYCNELNRDYKQIPVFMALSRQLGLASIHFNCQALNRAWDKLREHSDCYILCRSCKVLFGKLVIQKVRIYDKYESALNAIPPYRVHIPLRAGKEATMNAKIERERYYCMNGEIQSGTLIYWNKSNYDTRAFKKMLEKGVNYEQI